MSEEIVTQREPGFYWVILKGEDSEWEVGQWMGSYWVLCTLIEEEYYDSEMERIHETPIPCPSE